MQEQACRHSLFLLSDEMNVLFSFTSVRTLCRALRRAVGVSASLLLAAACGPGSGKARFEGKLANISQAEFYAYSDDGELGRVDTLRIDDGEFSYERKLSHPVLVTLLYPNFTQTQIILEPGKTVKMKGDAARIGEAEITGTTDNELLTDFRLANLSGPASNHRLAAAQFVRDHPGTLAAVAVYRKYFATAERPDAAEALRLLDLLRKAQPEERAVAWLVRNVRPRLLSGGGRPLPDFTVQTLEGRTVSVRSCRGKNLVVAFCATWNGESMTFVRELWRTVCHDDGARLLIVSLDADPQTFTRRLRADSVQAAAVCDGRMWSTPLVSLFGVRYVPSCLVADAEGRVVARDVTDVRDVRLP